MSIFIAPLQSCRVLKKLSANLLLGHLDGSVVDTLDHVVRVLAVNGATDRLGGTKDLLDGTGQGLSERLVGHLSSDLDNLVQRNVTRVLDVLLLLSVSNGLVERLDDQGRGRGDNRDLGLTVLDSQLDGNSETLPVTGSLGDVFSDLLGGLLGVLK